MTFKFDKRAIENAVQPQMKQATVQLNRDYADMGRRFKGKPVEEIKSELVRYHTRNPGDISEPELTEYAEALHEGTEIKFTYAGST